jgi:hypothetical protein
MQIYPHALCDSHSVNDLLGQLVISRHDAAIPPTWINYKLGNFNLSHCPSAPCSEIRNEYGQTLGYCIGHYLTEPGELLGKLDLLPHKITDESIEKFIGNLTGCFIVFIEVNGKPRIYLDPCGSSPVVYAPSEVVAATSPSLIPYGSDTQDNVELIDAVGVPYSKATFPLGITPRHGVFRLLPGHYLELDGWRAVRHWPKGPFRENPDTSAAVSEIASILSKVVGGIARKYPIQMSLTAGQDSRMILACSRGYTDNISFFTYEIPDDMGSLDSYLAKRMARRFKLDHQVILPERSSIPEREMWLYRTGCVGGQMREIDFVPMFKNLDRGRAKLPGVVGEIARGYLWKKTGLTASTSKADVWPRTLLQLAHAPETDELIGHVEQWCDALPCNNGLQLLDMFFIENSIGCMDSAFNPAYAGMPAFELWPLNNRRILELMLSLPVDYRKEQRLSTDIINLCWPELLEFPFNKWDFTYKFLTAISNPAWAFKKLSHNILEQIMTRRSLMKSFPRQAQPTQNKIDA